MPVDQVARDGVSRIDARQERHEALYDQDQKVTEEWRERIEDILKDIKLDIAHQPAEAEASISSFRATQQTINSDQAKTNSEIYRLLGKADWTAWALKTSIAINGVLAMAVISIFLKLVKAW